MRPLTKPKGAVVNLQAIILRAGRWTIEHWDTMKGQVTSVGAPLVGVPVGQDGKLTIALPDITWDAALRLRREP